jgi:phosphohistidine phosphatase SixA
VIVYLVRHATAGHRREWDGDDRLRPLDERGRRQAEALVGQLDGRDVGRIVTSPYARCVETVVPLAEVRGIELELEDVLGEPADPEGALALFRASSVPLVASIHGDLAEELLGGHVKKGSTTVLDVDAAGGLVVLERLAPQA